MFSLNEGNRFVMAQHPNDMRNERNVGATPAVRRPVARKD